MTRAKAQRRATLERQLARYLAQPLPPASNPATLKRRATFRRRVVRDFLRRLRCLTEQGTEVGWTRTVLTTEDEARSDALLRHDRSPHKERKP
jgi:hypothetical protein